MKMELTQLFIFVVWIVSISADTVHMYSREDAAAWLQLTDTASLWLRVILQSGDDRSVSDAVLL